MVKQLLIKRITSIRITSLKTVSLFVVASMMFLLAGCGYETVREGNEKETKVSKVSTEEAYKNHKGGNLKMVADDVTPAHFDDKNGRYHVFRYKDGGSIAYPSIKYVDYKACKEVWLCNKPNCEHSDYDCTAVLPKEINNGFVEPILFGDDEYLYLIIQIGDTEGMASTIEYVAPGWEHLLEGDASEETVIPTIYRMKKDGTEREKIFEFESGIVVEPEILLDGKYMYFISKKNKDIVDENTTYTTSYDRQLVRLDLAEGNTEKLFSLNNGQSIFGCSGRNVVLSETKYEREVSVEFKYTHPKEYDKMYQKSERIYSKFNVDTRNLNTIKKIKNTKEHSECVYDGYLYATYEAKKGIEKINIENGESESIKTDKIFGLTGVTVRGKSAVLECWVDGDKKPYLVNLNTGEYFKSTLSNRYKKPIEIVSQNDEYLFVRNDYEKDMEGNPHKYYYSIISKKDYLNNKPNYKSVEMTYSGIAI